MMNVNFFEDQARNSTRDEFNEDWADVIEDIEINSTSLITEDCFFMFIIWDDNGNFMRCSSMKENLNTYEIWKK